MSPRKRRSAIGNSIVSRIETDQIKSSAIFRYTIEDVHIQWPVPYTNSSIGRTNIVNECSRWLSSTFARAGESYMEMGQWKYTDTINGRLFKIEIGSIVEEVSDKRQFVQIKHDKQEEKLDSSVHGNDGIDRFAQRLIQISRGNA